jgi:hypothetical protein
MYITHTSIKWRCKGYLYNANPDKGLKMHRTGDLAETYPVHQKQNVPICKLLAC